jgi:hypothetical protein
LELRTAASCEEMEGSGPLLPPQPATAQAAAARKSASSIGPTFFGIAAIVARGLKPALFGSGGLPPRLMSAGARGPD